MPAPRVALGGIQVLTDGDPSGRSPVLGIACGWRSASFGAASHMAVRPARGWISLNLSELWQYANVSMRCAKGECSVRRCPTMGGSIRIGSELVRTYRTHASVAKKPLSRGAEVLRMRDAINLTSTGSPV